MGIDIDKKIGVARPNLVCVNEGLSQLRKLGFSNTHGMTSLEEIVSGLRLCAYDILFIEDTWNKTYNFGIDFIKDKIKCFDECKFVLISTDLSIEQFYLGAKSGLMDILVCSKKFDLGKEALHLLANSSVDGESSQEYCKVKKLGFFRTLGLTSREMEVLDQYMLDFPQLKELSKRVGKSAPQLRKMFSSIYRKLSSSLAVDNSTQLVRLLTISEFYLSS